LFENVIGLILEGAVVFLSIVILKIYFGVFFEERQREMRGCIVWIMYVIWQIVISWINILPGYINVLISIALVTIICIFSYDGNKGQMIVFSILINTIWMLAELLVGYLFLLFDTQIHYYIPQLFGSLFSKLLTLMLIVGIKIFFGNENIKSLSKKNNMILLLIPIGSMFIVYNTFMISAIEENYQHIKISLISSVLVLVVNIIIFKLYLDLSKEFIRIAKKTHPDVEFIVGDMNSLSFKENTFDFVYSSLAIHYSSTPDKTYKEVYRILKKDGLFLFSVGHPIRWSSAHKEIDGKMYRIIGCSKDDNESQVFGNYNTFKEYTHSFFSWDVKEKLSFYVGSPSFHFKLLRKANFEVLDFTESSAIEEAKEVDINYYQKNKELPQFMAFLARK